MTYHPKIYFITGVCGVGKSAVIPYLKLFLNDKKYNIYDFDERGVPDEAGRNWRIKETKYWINFAKKNIKNNISTIICGFSNPEEIVNNNINFILLDADNKIIKNRIIGRYKTEKSKQELKRVMNVGVDVFVKNNVSFLLTFKNICEKDKRCCVVSTINKLPKDIAREIVKIIS